MSALRGGGRGAAELRLENSAQAREGFGHAGIDSAFRDVEDFGDLGEFQVLVMAQDNDGAVDLGQLEQGLADQFAFVGLSGAEVGSGVVGERKIGGVFGLGVEVVAEELAATLLAAEFVVTEVQSDAPEVSREAAGRLVGFAGLEKAKEGFLLEVVAVTGVTGHAGAKAADGLLPAMEKARECLMVVVGLEAQHALLVGRRAEPRER